MAPAAAITGRRNARRRKRDGRRGVDPDAARTPRARARARAAEYRRAADRDYPLTDDHLLLDSLGLFGLLLRLTHDGKVV